MKTLVIFYSYTGRTRTISRELAAKEQFDITEIKSAKRIVKLRAYTTGIIASIKGKPWPIQPLDVDLPEYDNLVLLSPVWAGNPPPAVNAFIELLPTGKAIAVKMVSASGKSECRDRLETKFREKECTLESFEDIQTRKA